MKKRLSITIEFEDIADLKFHLQLVKEKVAHEVKNGTIGEEIEREQYEVGSYHSYKLEEIE